MSFLVAMSFFVCNFWIVRVGSSFVDRLDRFMHTSCNTIHCFYILKSQAVIMIVFTSKYISDQIFSFLVLIFFRTRVSEAMYGELVHLSTFFEHIIILWPTICAFALFFAVLVPRIIHSRFKRQNRLSFIVDRKDLFKMPWPFCRCCREWKQGNLNIFLKTVLHSCLLFAASATLFRVCVSFFFPSLLQNTIWTIPRSVNAALVLFAGWEIGGEANREGWEERSVRYCEMMAAHFVGMGPAERDHR